jgi:hypothetical protein
MAFTMHNTYEILSHLWSIKKLVILWDIQNINFQKNIMKYMLAQIIFGKKEKNIPWFQEPNPMKSSVLKTHPLNIEKNNFTWIKWTKTLIVQHLYNQIIKINIDMKDYYYFKMMKRHLWTIQHDQDRNTWMLQWKYYMKQSYNTRI